MPQIKYKKEHIVTSVVAVIVDDDDRVLLTRRNVSPFKDMWVMPGGKIDLGEPILKALHREVMEEVGLEVEIGELIDVFEHLTPGEENNHFIIIYYRCHPLSCEISHDHAEVAEARWVACDELADYPMPDGTRFILGKIFPYHRRRDDRQAVMVQIIDKKVNLEFPLGHHLHCLIAQIPNHLRRSESGFALVDPDRKWHQVKSVLDLVAAGEGNLKKLHFLMFPETSIPFARFDEMLATIEAGFRPNSVTMFGVEHVRLKTYRDLLERFREDNGEAIEFVDRDIDSGDVLETPVNWCCIAVKEATGRVRVFLEAKSHPFSGEEFLDKFHDLYRGRHFYLFRSRPACFNFMALICLDYLYRDLYSSNIKGIIDHADRLFFDTRQGLDALFVIQCNPKPEHLAYREVISGFYGEYLEDTPGVRETITVFGNTSDETRLEELASEGGFGHSFLVINRHHKLASVQLSEFATDDFGGAPVCRLRFGSGTRLYYFNLPLHHELDPRTSRVPLKVHSILRWSADGGWVRVTGEEMVGGFEIETEPDNV